MGTVYRIQCEDCGTGPYNCECAANKDGILYKDEYNDGDEGYATIADSMGVNIEGYDEDDPQSAP